MTDEDDDDEYDFDDPDSYDEDGNFVRPKAARSFLSLQQARMPSAITAAGSTRGA
jgi:hypothetical protein